MNLNNQLSFYFFDLSFQFAFIHPNDSMAHISAGIIDASTKLPYFILTKSKEELKSALQHGAHKIRPYKAGQFHSLLDCIRIRTRGGIYGQIYP